MSRKNVLTERELYLADALWRMMLMHEAVLEETAIENISYKNETRREMGEAPVQAEIALRRVGYSSLPYPFSDGDLENAETALMPATKIAGKPN